MRATILLCSLLTTTPILAQDTIVTSDGKTVSGRVTEYNVSELIYRADGGRGDETIPREKVISVELGQRAWVGNRYVKKARDEDANENLNEAYLLYLDAGDRLLKVSAVAKWAPQFAYWRAYKIARDNGFNSANILDAAEQLTTKVPNTAFLPDLWRIRIRDAWNAGDDKASLENTKKQIEAFQQLCDGKGLSNRYKYEGEMLMILIRQRLKDSSLPPAEAQKALAALESKCEGIYPDLANRLKLESAKSVLMTGNNDEARAMFEAIIKSGTADPETMAGAFLGRGHTAWRKVSRSDDDALGALADYMRVAILYADADPEVVSEALYHALQAYQKWRPNAQTEPRRIYSILKTRYKNTSWGKK